MSRMKEKVKEYLDSIECKYWIDEEKDVLIAVMGTDNLLGDMNVFIVFEENNFIVYTYLSNKIEETFFPDAGEYLHRANYGLKNGNFEMDYRNGKIRYKTFTNIKNTEISKEVMKESIFMGVSMMEQYGRGLLKIMQGEGTPGELIEESEKSGMESREQTVPPSH